MKQKICIAKFNEQEIHPVEAKRIQKNDKEVFFTCIWCGWDLYPCVWEKNESHFRHNYKWIHANNEWKCFLERLSFSSKLEIENYINIKEKIIWNFKEIFYKHSQPNNIFKIDHLIQWKCVDLFFNISGKNIGWFLVNQWSRISNIKKRFKKTLDEIYFLIYPISNTKLTFDINEEQSFIAKTDWEKIAIMSSSEYVDWKKYIYDLCWKWKYWDYRIDGNNIEYVEYDFNSLSIDFILSWKSPKYDEYLSDIRKAKSLYNSELARLHAEKCSAIQNKLYEEKQKQINIAKKEEIISEKNKNITKIIQKNLPLSRSIDEKNLSYSDDKINICKTPKDYIFKVWDKIKLNHLKSNDPNNNFTISKIITWESGITFYEIEWSINSYARDRIYLIS